MLTSVTPLFTSDDRITVAAGHIWATQLATIAAHEAAVRERADETGVHEIRKAIRRSRTAFKLFKPFFAPHLLAPCRHCLKELMGELGRARDTAVFLAGLATAIDETAPRDRDGLQAVAAYWQEEKRAADVQVRRMMADPFRACIAAFTTFVATGIPAAAIAAGQIPAIQTLAPGLIEERLIAVRTYEGALDGCSLARLHQLRIQFKELRYTLDFFRHLLRPPIDDLLLWLDEMQDCLGAINDGRIALEMLDEMKASPGSAAAAGAQLYASSREREITALRQAFAGRWQEFNRPEWQQQLTTAVAAF